MSNRERSIKKYSELFGRIGRIFYDETSLCILDAVIKLYFKNFVFELGEVVKKTNLEKNIVRGSLYSFAGAKLIKNVEIYEIEHDDTGIRDYVVKNFELKKKFDINNKLEFWKLNDNIKGKKDYFFNYKILIEIKSTSRTI